MKTLFFVVSALLMSSCGSSSGDSGNYAETWSQPENTQQAYDQLIGKTFNGANGNYFRFNASGSFEAVFTALSDEVSGGANVQKTYTCQVSASTFSVVAIDNPDYGSFYIQLNSITENRIGVPGTATLVLGCFVGSGKLFFKRNDLSNLRFDISNYHTSTPPTNQGFYEGNGYEYYTRQ